MASVPRVGGRIAGKLDDYGMIAKKIDAMHSIYGAAEGICGDCPHFVRFRYHDRVLLKCRAYGLTHSEATDWRVKYAACGLKDLSIPDMDIPMIDRLRGKREYIPEPQCDGQISIYDFLS